MVTARLLAIAFLVPTAFALVPQEPYPIFENDKPAPSETRVRRERVRAAMSPGSVAVFFTNPERNRSNDTDHPYRFNSDFYYLTGGEEPDMALVMARDGFTLNGKMVREVLFVNDRNPAIETWNGYRMGPEGAKKILEIEEVLSNSKFREVLASLGKAPRARTEMPQGATGSLNRMVNDYRTSGEGVPAAENLIRTVGSLRTVKSKYELEMMQRAIDASVRGHIEAMRSCEPGMRESDIQAIVEYFFTRGGCEHVAYGSIVGSGANGCILHYNTNRKIIKAGDIICMDVGGEYHGYAADVTRSYPANGKFTADQRALYEIVLAAQKAGIAACVDGANFGASHQAASKVVADGLKRLGIIKEDREIGRYFMHGTSHYLGLDVHDPQVEGVLRPNHVLTVEPGIYIKAGSPCDKRWWNIGIRIEDDILVTPTGPVNLSAGAPREIAQIERLMAETGLGNVKDRPLRP